MSDERRNVTFQQKMTQINNQMTKKNLLGIFDSGIGGFSVFKEVRKNTKADIIYYGDCARAPYGNRSEDEIVSFIKEIISYLKSKGVTHFISACNSMSVLTTKSILRDLHIDNEKYFDMIYAVKNVEFKNDATVLIIGTAATIKSGVYQDILNEKNISNFVYSPIQLAGYIEENNITAIHNECNNIILHAKKFGANVVVYACTHYPLADAYFLDAAQKNNWEGEFIDPAQNLGNLISKLDLTGDGSSLFEASSMTIAFKEYAKNAVE